MLLGKKRKEIDDNDDDRTAGPRGFNVLVCQLIMVVQDDKQLNYSEMGLK